VSVGKGAAVPARFAFLHVGDDVTLPAILVKSIRRFHPAATIAQCTDKSSPAVAGVDEVSRLEGDSDKLMTFRLASFAALQAGAPTLFLDTDMIVLAKLDFSAMLDRHDVAVCRRQFDLNVEMSPRLRNLEFSEHAGRTLGEVYPYLACTTLTRDNAFWLACLAELERLDAKLHVWYGDQQAIREVVNSGRFRVRLLPESVYACLPNRPQKSSAPRILHFKGPALKQAMIDAASGNPYKGER